MGGLEVPYEPLSYALSPSALFGSSLDIHAFSYYYGDLLLRRLGIPRTTRLILFVLSSIGWEVFETYGWRTTPISLTDLAANTVGFISAEIFGDRLELVLGLHPIFRYPSSWIARGEVNDGSPTSMLMGRFNTNYSPHTLYANLRLSRATLQLGYNLGASLSGAYMYAHPYDTSAIPMIYVSTRSPLAHISGVPLPPVATRCDLEDPIRCFWNFSPFVRIILNVD